MKKRIVALLLVLVLLVAASTTAFAAKPTAKIYASSKNQTVKAGKTILFKFLLNSGSYTKKNDAFRAKLGSIIIYNSKQIGAANWVWTGKQIYHLKANIKKSTPAGEYTLKYTTYCRSKATASWKKVKTASTKFTVKK